MPVAALEAVAGDRSRDLGGDRSSGRLPRPVHGLSSSPSSHTGIVSDVPGRLSSGSSLAARGRGDACQRSLRNRPRSGSRLSQSPLPGGESDWGLEACDRPLSFERLRPADVVQDGNSRFGAVICQRGGFSSFLGSEGRVLSDPDPRIIEEAVEVHVRGDSLPVQSPVLRSVDCSPGLYQGLRGGVSLGTLRYLDDWLVLSSSEKKAKESIRELLLVCHTLEIVINEKKSDLVPSQSEKYFGMTIDTGAGKVFMSIARVKKFLSVAEIFCSMQFPPAQLWQVILGHLASLERLVPHGRLRMRSLQWHLKMQWSPESDPPSLPVALVGGSETGSVLVDGEGSPVDGGLIRGTCAGSAPVFGRVFVGVGCSPPRSKRVRGVVRPGEVVTHQSSRNEGPLSGSSGFSRRCSRSSCDRDVRQLHGCSVRQQTGGHGLQVPVFVDQPPSEMDGGFRRPSRCEVSTRRVQRPGRCSQPSRASCRDRVVSPPSGGEGTSSCVGQSINRPVCDLPQHEAAPVLLACPGSPGRLRDAFHHPWDDLDLYAFPPFALVGRVIARVQQSSRVAMTLVAPLWPEEEWFADLLLLLTQPPLALLCWDKLLRQPHCSLFHQGVHALNLHAWRLSSDTTESRAFREELLESCQGSSESPPLDCTSRDGSSSVVGVVEGALLQSTPLFL